MTQPFQRINLNISASVVLPANPVSMAPVPGGGFLLNFANSPEVWCLDKDMNLLWQKDMQAQSLQYCSCKLTVSRDGGYIALSGRDQLRILTLSGEALHILTHRPWYYFLGSECYMDGEHAWYVMPGREDGDDDILQVLRLADFQVLGEYILYGNQSHSYSFIPTPDPGKVLLSAAAGEDTALLYTTSFTDGKITVEPLKACDDYIFGSFSANGKAFVAAPHYDEGLAVFSFPEMQMIASREQVDIFAGRDEYPSEDDEDSLNYVSFFLGNDHCLIFSRYGRLLVLDRHSLACVAELCPEDSEIRAYDMAGRPTTEPADIVDYGGDIIELWITPQNKLMVTLSNGELRQYDLPGEFIN